MNFWDEHEFLGYVVAALPSLLALGLFVAIWRTIRRPGRVRTGLLLSKLVPPVVLGFMTGLPAAILLRPELRDEYPHVSFWGLVLAIPAAFISFCLAFGVDLLLPNFARRPRLSRTFVICFTLTVFLLVAAIYGFRYVSPPL